MDEKMKEAMKDIFEKMTDEQKEKVNACKNADELMKSKQTRLLELF